MDTFAKLIIVVVLSAFYAPSHSATYTPDFGELKVIDGDLHMTRGNGTTSIMYPNAGLSKSIDVSTSKGNFPVPIEKSFPVIPAKVGAAATRFLKTLPAIGTAIALYDTVCDLTNICKQDNELVYMQSPNYYNSYPPSSCSGYPYGTDAYYNYSAGGYQHFITYTTPQAPDGYQYAGYYCANHNPKYSVGVKLVPVLPDSSVRQLDEQDWDEAEVKLSAEPERVSQSLYDAGAPLPVDASTQSSPVTQQISQISTQTKDAQGNVVGTQVVTTSVKVEDTSTASNVTYNVTETTTITNYNENNEITSTQTSTSDTEQPKAAEDTDISFDNVSDAQLETEEIDVQLETPVSWGEGTCPPDETLTLQGRSYSISYEPACDAAADLRPIFVLLASVTALFIVAGVSRSRGD